MEREIKVYPILIKGNEKNYYVEIPDFEIGTQGDTIAEAIIMARDAIGLMINEFLTNGNIIPDPNTKSFTKEADDIITLMDVDVTFCKRKLDNRMVKKNCILPYWMTVQADKIGINYSRVLQEALFDIIKSKGE